MAVAASIRSEQAARALVIALLCSLPALICLRAPGTSVTDPDLGWHLSTGAWIVQHHAVPHSDPFSRLTAAPWQAYSWLFDLVLLKIYAWFNLKGIVLFTAAVLVAVAAAVFRLVSRLSCDFARSLLLTAAVMLCMVRIYTPRPWLFTILFFVLELDILMRARQTGSSRGLLWLPPLFILWANIHIQFIDGLLVLAIAACEPLLRHWWKSEARLPRARHLWLALLASIAATLVNPYGPGLYKVAETLTSQPGVLNMVSEMQSLPFRSFTDFLLLFMALFASGVLFRFLKLAPFETLLLVLAAVLSFRSQRDLWIMAMIAAMIIAAGLPAGAGARKQPPLPFWAVCLGGFASAGLILVCAPLLQVANARLLALQSKEYPAQAVDVIRQRHYTGPLFNTYNWGGYLIWKLGEPVSIDGRAGLYGDDRIRRSIATWSGKPGWASDSDLTSAGVVIGPSDDALMQLLRYDPRFVLAYQDKTATVFVSRQDGKVAGDSRTTLDRGIAQP